MKANEVKALITGGVSGLGLAVARKVVEGGGQAVLLDATGMPLSALTIPEDAEALRARLDKELGEE